TAGHQVPLTPLFCSKTRVTACSMRPAVSSRNHVHPGYRRGSIRGKRRGGWGNSEMLSNTTVKNAKAAAKPYKLSDERGLFLHVQPTGAKWWRFKYMFAGKEKLLSLGTYPDTSLALAREKRDKARQQVA